jgi:cobalt-zinc-cadmium efflux system membrane fusion protein
MATTQDNPSVEPRVEARGTTTLRAALGWVTSLATTAALVAIGWQGHATHWTFGLDGHHAGHDAAAPHHSGNRTVRATAADGVIRFPSRAALERTGIEIVPVERRPITSALACSGVVAYDEKRIAQLSTRVPGSVWRVEKHLGDEVRRGDVLLIVESQDVGRLKAEFLNALVAYESRREQLAILEEVKGAVMGRQLREARAAVREARNQLMNAEQALVNLGFDLVSREYEALDDDARAARIRTLGLHPRLVAGIDSARLTSNLLPLYAPFDGVVVGREAVVGEVVEAARPIFEVADVATMLLVLDVSKEDADRVAVGQTVRFRPDGSPEELTSRVAWISTEVNEETRTLRVRAEVANRVAGPADGSGESGTLLKAHMFGRGSIEISRRGEAVVVPRSSVQWDGDRWVVFVPVGDDAFTARAVAPGDRDGEAVEITGTVASDPRFTHVVAGGSHVLKSKLLLERMESGGP